MYDEDISETASVELRPQSLTIAEQVNNQIKDYESKLKDLNRLKNLLDNNPEIEQIMSLFKSTLRKY